MNAVAAPSASSREPWRHPGEPGRAARSVSPRVTKVFRLGLLIIVIHVLDTGLVQVNQGVARAEHLSAVLVPVAAVLLAGWALPRLRPLTQAALLLATGVLATTEGGLELAHLVNQGMSGDDLTGLLVLVAGLVMTAIGGVQLWSGRKREGRRAQVLARRAAWSVVAALVVFYVGGALAWGIAAVSLPDPSMAAAELNQPVETVSLEAEDGVVLSARYVPSRNRSAVMVSPSSSTAHARLLADAGYGVLLVDNRGQGRSGGDPNEFGWEASLDHGAGLDYLLARADVDPSRIGALGLSVGGEGLLETAAARPELAAVVSEGAGIRSWAEAKAAGSLVEMSVWGPLSLTTTITSGDLPPASLHSLMPQIAPRPVLLIHAQYGQAGEHHNPRYAELLGPSAQLWTVNEGSHVGGLREHPAEYARRVVGFFDEALAS